MRTDRLVLGSLLALAVGLSFRPDVLSAQDETKPGPSENQVSELPRVPDELHDRLQDRNFVAAIRLIDEILPNQTAPHRDYLLYLKGRAQTELNLSEQATETFTRLETDFPESAWVARARFGRADVLARQRNYRAAGEIYQAEARRLLSDGRRDELAGIYLEFADRYFEGVPQDGPTDEKKPDYQQALTYYREALKLTPSLPRRQRIEFRIARSLHETGQLAEAISAYQSHLNSDSPPADLQAQTRFELGRAQLAAGQNAEARRTWRDLLADTGPGRAGPDRRDTSRLGDDLVPQTTFLIARTYGVPAPPTIADLELGVAALERFLEQFPKHKQAAQAEFEIAQSYMHHGRFDQAIERLTSLIGNEGYATSEHLASARQLLGQSFQAQKKFDEAIAAWKAFLDAHPANPHWSEVQQQVVDAEFQQAAEQMRQKNFES
ncbi:MAG: tetratricopeptide repeat protein, partial [Planctomycetaceae bacterium]